MATILDDLMKRLGGTNLQRLGLRLGTDEGTTRDALSAALPVLLGALQRNASRASGARALADALRRDHDGSVLEAVENLIRDPAGGGGDGILRHVLGGDRGRVEQGLSRATGLGGSSVGSLLQVLAPLLLGALGRRQREGGLDASDLSRWLRREQREGARRDPRQRDLLRDVLGRGAGARGCLGLLAGLLVRR